MQTVALGTGARVALSKTFICTLPVASALFDDALLMVVPMFASDKIFSTKSNEKIIAKTDFFIV
jgi:hypothetical protein